MPRRRFGFLGEHINDNYGVGVYTINDAPGLIRIADS
jgi:hypothetical protein